MVTPIGEKARRVSSCQPISMHEMVLYNMVPCHANTRG